MNTEELDEKNAKLTMKLVAKSGYKSTSEYEISVNQWNDIQLVLAGKLKSKLKEDGDSSK